MELSRLSKHELNQHNAHYERFDQNVTHLRFTRGDYCLSHFLEHHCLFEPRAYLVVISFKHKVIERALCKAP